MLAVWASTVVLTRFRGFFLKFLGDLRRKFETGVQLLTIQSRESDSDSDELSH